MPLQINVFHEDFLRNKAYDKEHHPSIDVRNKGIPLLARGILYEYMLASSQEHSLCILLVVISRGFW